MSRTVALIVLAACAVALPASAQTTLRAGQSVSGQLTASDPTLPDASHYDCYAIEVPAGMTLTVTQRSTAFDSYLSVGQGQCGALTGVATNDDMASGVLDSQVALSSTGGRYLIHANSLSGGQTGAYTIQATIDRSAVPAAAASAPAANAGLDFSQGPRLTPVPAPGPSGQAPMTFDRAVECGAIWLVRFMMPEYQDHPRDVIDNYRTMAGVMIDRAVIEGRSAGRTREQAQEQLAETAALLQMQVDAAGTFPEGQSGLDASMSNPDIHLARAAVASSWEPYENGCMRDSVRR